jgi:hypothetical protein
MDSGDGKKVMKGGKGYGEMEKEKEGREGEMERREGRRNTKGGSVKRKGGNKWKEGVTNVLPLFSCSSLLPFYCSPSPFFVFGLGISFPCCHRPSLDGRTTAETTEGQTDRPTGRQKDRRTGWTDTRIDRQRERDRDKQTDRRDRQTDGQETD